jgi:hypothetical protein
MTTDLVWERSSKKSGSQKVKSTMKELATQIYKAVRSGKLNEPFSAAAVKRACPGWAERTYHVFLPKHCEGNGRTTELFIRLAPGLYKLRDLD